MPFLRSIYNPYPPSLSKLAPLYSQSLMYLSSKTPVRQRVTILLHQWAPEAERKQHLALEAGRGAKNRGRCFS